MKRLVRLAAIVFAGAVWCTPSSATAESYTDENLAAWAWEWDETESSAVLYGVGFHSVSSGVPSVVTVPSNVPATLTGWRWNDETGEYEEYDYQDVIPVTGLGDYLFEGLDMTEVVLPDTIREIGYGAFSGCSLLETVNVPGSLVACDASAFEDTAWQDAQTGDFLVFGPVLLEYRGTNTVIEIPDGVGVIPEDVFSGNEDITSVAIPSSVWKIDDYAFADCANLLTVSGADGVEVCGCETFDGTAFWEAAGSNVPVRVGSAVVGYKGTLPETLEIAEGVACIADEAFAECPDFTTVSFPASLRRIGNRSFAECFVWAAIPGDGDDTASTATAGYADDGSSADSTGGDNGGGSSSGSSTGADSGEIWIVKGLTRVVIPQTLESIGEDAFAYCYALTDVTIEGGEAFEDVFLCSVFDDCPVANLSINRSWVGEDCWFETLESLTLGDDVCEIDEEAFAGCDSLVSVTFGEGLEYIGAYAFEGCSALTSITIPASVTEIAEEAFAGCDSLASVTFGEGLEYIGAYAFEGCSALTSITIPASVTEIAEGAFADCEALEEVVFEGDMDEIEMDVFDAFDGTPWLDEAFPAPENDDFANAELLEGESGSVEGTLQYATVEMGDCALDFTDPLATVWYKWKAPFSGTVVFTADAANEEDSWLFRLIATRGRANGNAGDDDEEYGSAVAGSAEDSGGDTWGGDTGSDIWGGATSGSDTSGSDSSGSDSGEAEEEWVDCCYSDANWVVFDVVEGETYYLSVAVIDDEDPVESGDFTLSWEQVYRPENDNFADAIELTGESGSVMGTNILATAEEDDPLAYTFESEATVWWKWTAETDGAITFDTIGSDFDTVIGVYAGESLDTLEEVAWGGVEDGEPFPATVETTAGTTYYIAVGGYEGESGEIALNWYRYQLVIDEDGVLSGYLGTLPEELEIPEEVTAIDDYALAESATLRSVSLSASVRSVGARAFAWCEALESVTIPASVEEIGYGAFEDCTSLSEVEFEGERDEIDMNPMDAFYGTPWKEDTYLAEFDVPENDNFADAFELTGITGSVTGTNILATAEEDDPLQASSYGSEATVWWKWTAETNDWVSFDVAGSNFHTGLGVYTGESPDTLETVAEHWAYVTFEAVAGTTYYIAVGGRGDAAGKIVLEWYRYKPYIEDGVLYGYYGTLPETLDIPEGVTRIEAEAFYNYDGDTGATVKTVNLPESLESIGGYAFAEQSALETVNGLGETVDVAPGAFFGTPFQWTSPFRLLINKDNVLTGFLGVCPETLEIPANVQKIGMYAFRECANLETVVIANPDVVFSGAGPFEWCWELTSIEMAKEGYTQDAWLVTFDTDNVYAWPDEDGDDWLLPYKAGDTMTFAADDLTCLMYYIEVTNSVGQVGYLEHLVEEYDGDTGVSTYSDAYHITAHWVLNAYTLTFDSAGGSEVAPVTQEAGTEVVPPATPVREGFTFVRWEPELPATMPATNLTFTAVWEEIVEPTPSIPEIFEEEQTDAFAGNAQYTGWLRDADGNLVGTVTVKASKANAKTKVSKLTATVVMLADGKKLTFNGTATAGQLANVALTGKSGSMNVTLSDDSVSGTFGAYTIEAAKNVFTSKDSGDKASAAIVAKKTWTVTLASAKGYTPFTFAVAAKGKTKVTGVLPDGTKVSVSAQAVVGDGGRWAVPVMYAKKSRFGFVAWFEKGADGQTALTDVSDLTPLRGPKGAVTEWAADLDACGPVGSLAAGAHVFAVAAEDVAALVPGVNADLLPIGEAVTVAKGKWTLAKAAKVAYKGQWTVTPGTKGGAAANAAGVKLTFTAKTGTFKGSFTAYSVKGGKLAKTKFTVNGAVVNGIAYGTAFNKTAGSVPVVIE